MCDEPVSRRSTSDPGADHQFVEGIQRAPPGIAYGVHIA
jgi:hypothetical protein